MHADDKSLAAQARPRKAPLPRATLFATGGAPATAAPLDAVIHAALEELHVVVVVAAPGMDLAATQLALDCVAESPRCLKEAAAQDHAQVLVSPSLQRLPDSLVLSLLRFDTRQGELRRVVRRSKGTSVGRELLDEVPNMLRELFDLPQLAVPPVAEAESEQPAPAPASPERTLESRQRPSISAGPLVLAGVGAASMIAAVSLGVLMKNTQADYDRIRGSVSTMADAQAAADARSRGKTEAALADVFFAVGGGALAASAIWLALDLNSTQHEESATASIRPWIGSAQLGLVLTKRGGGL